MAIPESDISVLIPTYRYRDKVGRAVASALDSGAGEILVVDDRSDDGTRELVAAIRDSRLSFIENETNLGLWENHLRALGAATRPWIKFIQADDYLLPGGLAKYAAVAAADVSVVTAAPVMRDDATGETWLTYALAQPARLDWAAFERMCLCFGNFLGSPSYMMLRADAIDRDPALWRTQMSADMVAGAIAASQGAVVVLPPGAVGHGVHARQDAKTQRSVQGLQRMANSLAYLRARPEPGLRRLANLWTLANLRAMARTFVRGVVRDVDSRAELVRCLSRLLVDPSLTDWREMLAARTALSNALQARSRAGQPFDLQRLLAHAP
ncbi:glycosyltransferase family 2 protein [Ramlibacter sp. PS4R-6]|uniref:glycosyltransferase family 2 protein n=1 Tax=Ramlibacter sp. PS4R-6 TaxID=3133438 RepID=UPI00309E53FF